MLEKEWKPSFIHLVIDPMHHFIVGLFFEFLVFDNLTDLRESISEDTRRHKRYTYHESFLNKTSWGYVTISDCGHGNYYIVKWQQILFSER